MQKSAKQADERMKLGKELPANPEDQCFNRRIVTCDENESINVIQTNQISG